MATRCVFCEIVAKTRTANIVYEDDEYMAFHDILPDAEYHLQLIPKTHVKNLGACTKEDIPMLRTIESIGKQVLTDILTKDNKTHLLGTFRFGFHAPANTSVDHLHCHCIAGERKWKTFITHNKMFPWFICLETAVLRLSRLAANQTYQQKH